MQGCPDPSLLDAFCRGTLDPERRGAVERHLDACPHCSATVAHLVHAFGSSWGGPPPSMPPMDASVADGSRVTAADPAAQRIDDTLYAGVDPGQPGAAPVHVGRYQLGRRLGAGGMGMVFEAHDPELHRLVAIKLLHPGVTEDADVTRARLLREARAMARLAHPNVVAVHDVGAVGEQVFIAMELVRGSTLGQWIAAAPRSLREIVAVFVQAGRGLQAAHAVGLVHRDFKPDNVLIGEDGRPRVTDFGLARPATAWPTSEPGAPESDGGIATTAAGPTAAGALVGTPAYMAPEQWRGATADARSDQFSFCVALYEALFGQRPFAGKTLAELADSVTCGRMRPVPRSAPGRLRGALVRGLAVEPAARHSSMNELLAVLQRDGRRVVAIGAIAGAMTIGAVATAGVLGWVADSTSAVAASAEGQEAQASETGEGSGATVEPPDRVAPPVDVEACRARAHTGDGRFTHDRRIELEERIAKMDDARQIAERTLPALDAWIAEYARQAEAECDPNARVEHAQARRACRDDALARFDALVRESLRLETFKVQGSLPGAVHRLPAIDRCDDSGWLSAWPQPDPAKAASARLLRSELAAVEVEASLFQLVSAPQAAEALAKKAEALGEPVVSAEIQLATGSIAAQRGQHEIAVDWLRPAAVAAETARHDQALLAVAIALAEQEGAYRLRFSEAEGWQRTASERADRLADARSFAELSRVSGRILHARGELEAAREELEHAIAAASQLSETPLPVVAEARLAASAVALDLGDVAAAREHAESARTILAATVGPGDLDLARAEAAVGRALLAAGDLQGAEDAARRAVKIVPVSASLRHDLDRGRWILLLADVLAARGADEAAIAEYDRAPIYLYEGPPKAEPAIAKAEMSLARGRADEAALLLSGAVAELEVQFGADDPRLLEPLSRLGRAQAAAGREAQARTTLERAVALADAQVGYGPLLARAQVDLGDLERASGNHERALELYDEAHVPLTGAYGLHHPVVVGRVLDRADLAWDLGQTEYAARLYGSVRSRLSEERGPTDPATKRALDRAGAN